MALHHLEAARRAGYQAMLADPERKARMIRRVDWTPDMVEALKHLRQHERKSIDHCADRIGVNKCVIVKQLDTLGLPRKVR